MRCKGSRGKRERKSESFDAICIVLHEIKRF